MSDTVCYAQRDYVFNILFSSYGLIPAIMFVHEAMGFHQVETYYIFAERCCCVAVDGLLSILIRPYGTQRYSVVGPKRTWSFV